MKTTTRGIKAMAVGLAVLAAACGGSSDDDTSAGAGAMSAGAATATTPAASSSAALAAGTYVLENDSVGATLTITNATSTSASYSLGILGKTGSEHNGELDGRTAKRTGSNASYDDTVDSDCKVSLQAAGADSVAVKQTGSCSDAGFGAFLDGTGTYKKSAGWVGLYENETTHRAWAIRVTSENPFSFHLFAGHLEDASERVDAKNLVGKLDGGSVLFENGPDCSITLAKTESGLHVTQAGTCAAIGFPTNDDLSMSDDSGTDFGRIDESKECFDTQELAVGSGPNVCKNPL